MTAGIGADLFLLSFRGVEPVCHSILLLLITCLHTMQRRCTADIMQFEMCTSHLQVILINLYPKQQKSWVSKQVHGSKI